MRNQRPGASLKAKVGARRVSVIHPMPRHDDVGLLARVAEICDFIDKHRSNRTDYNNTLVHYTVEVSRSLLMSLRI